MVGPTYEYKSTVLPPPPASSVGIGGNPYLGLSGLEQVVDVLTRSLTSQPVQDRLAVSWPGTEYVVERDVNTSGPIVIVTVDSPFGRRRRGCDIRAGEPGSDHIGRVADERKGAGEVQGDVATADPVRPA